MLKTLLEQLLKSRLSPEKSSFEISTSARSIIGVADDICMSPTVRTAVDEIRSVLHFETALYAPVQNITDECANAVLWMIEEPPRVASDVPSQEDTVRKWFRIVASSKDKEATESGWVQLLKALSGPANNARMQGAIADELAAAVTENRWADVQSKLFSLKKRCPEHPGIAKAEAALGTVATSMYDRRKGYFAASQNVHIEREMTSTAFQHTVPEPIKQVLVLSRTCLDAASQLIATRLARSSTCEHAEYTMGAEMVAAIRKCEEVATGLPS